MKLLLTVFALSSTFAFAADTTLRRPDPAKHYPTSDPKLIEQQGLDDRGPAGPQAEEAVKAGRMKHTKREIHRKQKGE